MEEEQLHDLEREVIECHIIRFCKPMMQKTAYELWLKDQKRDMHLKCARFLEESAHKCHRCRSGDFVPYHHFAVDIRLNSLDLRTIRKMVKAQGFKSKPPSLLNGPSHPRGVWRLRPGRPGSGPGASRVPGCNEPGEVGSGGLGGPERAALPLWAPACTPVQWASRGRWEGLEGSTNSEGQAAGK